MPVITGELKDIVGATLASRVGRLRFRLVEPSIVASGSSRGRIIPTADQVVTPASDDSWSINLSSTTSLANDAYYLLFIDWIEPGIPLTDDPGWKIRIGNQGGPLSSFVTFTESRGGYNFSQVILSLTEPPNLLPGQLWWQTNPDDPADPLNTGRIYRGV
ncbi:hypothetical protein [Pseudarthrobacter sp. PS3-L1]|uniref:hypothetical protein n=1 Tax=Pseudarthrobacter sp. PS3-L1 TaxID=3046207 RepID=UPI0024BA384E|nr:hypothetical protein [Pseudarthrobacter sp. PS3-L1]MDJ0321820.1 hypothetical protein [Pseudarthrobacter sp. PS3-L1]